jgi:hypothetical protein
MIARILRSLGLRRARRSSTHLTPKYEERRIRELRKARAMFTGESHV